MADQHADVRHIQEMLRAAGFYTGPIDGVAGPDTQAAQKQYNADRATHAAADQARANADAAAASAKAEEAKATAEATRAKAESERIAADAKKRADDATAETSKRIFDSSITAGAYVAGAAVGAKTAKTIDAKVAEGLANKNRELNKVSKQVAPLIEKIETAGTSKKSATLVQRTLQKIDALVATADKIGLTKVARGPAGPVAAVGMLAIGAVSRTAAAHTDNETVKTVLNASGTAEMVAGAFVGVKDLANRAAPTKTVDAKALSMIEQGRALVKGSSTVATVAAEVPSLAARVLKLSGKVALPVAVGMAAIEGVRGYNQDGVRGAVRGVLDSVDPTSILPGMEGKGLVERVFDRFAGSARRDTAGIASDRVAAGRTAANVEHKLELTPMAPQPSQSAPAPAQTTDQTQTAHIHHGWTDAARAASQRSRGVTVTIPSSR